MKDFPQTIMRPICGILRTKCEMHSVNGEELNKASTFRRLSLRIFSDPTDPSSMWKKNVKDIGGEILCVSQFTLLANTTKGNKPDFHRAMVSYNCNLYYNMLFICPSVRAENVLVKYIHLSSNFWEGLTLQTK